MACRAVAEERHADVVGATRAGAHAGSDGVADAGRHDPVGSEEAARAVVKVHGAAAAAAAAVALAVEFGHQNVGRHALGERMAVAAMRGGDPIGRSQQRTQTDRRSLLADVEMQEARRFALPAGDLRYLFELAQQHHAFVEADHLGGREPRRQVGASRRLGRRPACL